MRTLGLTLLAVFAAATPLLAQGSGTPGKDVPPLPSTLMSEKSKKYLDFYLAQWEERVSKIETLYTQIVFTQKSVGDGKVQTTVLTGDASIMKPNYARLLLKDREDPGNTRRWMHWVANGTHLWEYSYSSKIARVEELPKDGLKKHVAMSFLMGMKAEDIKKRFDVSIDADNPEKYTDFYLNLLILPKNKEDMQDFKKAELVFWKNTKDEKYRDVWMLPARIWFQEPNGNSTIWEFQNMTTKKKFLKDDFKEPGFPDKEWRSEWSRPPVPTVSRSVPPTK
jgi:TIGR03009 family protein